MVNPPTSFLTEQFLCQCTATYRAGLRVLIPQHEIQDLYNILLFTKYAVTIRNRNAWDRDLAGANLVVWWYFAPKMWSLS